MSLFTGKTLIITGGTGSFGNAVLNRFLRTTYWRNPYLFPWWEEAGWYASRISGEDAESSRQD